MKTSNTSTTDRIVNAIIFISAILILPFFFISFIFRIIGLGICYGIRMIFAPLNCNSISKLNEKMNDILLFLAPLNEK